MIALEKFKEANETLFDFLEEMINFIRKLF